VSKKRRAPWIYTFSCYLRGANQAGEYLHNGNKASSYLSFIAGDNVMDTKCTSPVLRRLTFSSDNLPWLSIWMIVAAFVVNYDILLSLPPSNLRLSMIGSSWRGSVLDLIYWPLFYLLHLSNVHLISNSVRLLALSIVVIGLEGRRHLSPLIIVGGVLGLSISHIRLILYTYGVTYGISNSIEMLIGYLVVLVPKQARWPGIPAM